MAKLQITINTGFVGATHEITHEIDDDTMEMGDVEREEVFNDMLNVEIANHIEGYWEVIDDEDGEDS
jgi:hypothetical protein